MAFCSTCGAQISDGTTTCAACAGRTATGPAAATTTTTGGMTDNVAGMLAYVTIIPAIIFLVMEPYNKSRFVRFHSFLALITIPLHFLIALGALVIWIILLMKANSGLMYKLPFIGDMAEKQANAM